MDGKWRKNKEIGLWTGDARGPGEERKGTKCIAMERREEKKRKISYRGVKRGLLPGFWFPLFKRQTPDLFYVVHTYERTRSRG